MILPSKHISAEQTLLGVGAILLQALEQACTVSSLWEKTKTNQIVGTFERFILALDMLYVLGAITITDSLLERTTA